MFRLTITDVVEDHDGVPFYRGTILIGDFEEEFLAAASLWSPSRYRNQWREAAATLSRGDRTAFITSFVHPDGINVLWPAWREGDVVYIRNVLSLPEHRKSILDPTAVASHVGERDTASPDGEVSEWTVPVRDISTFAS